MKIYVLQATEHDVLQAFLEEKLESNIDFSFDENVDNHLIYVVNGRIAAFTSVSYEKEIDNLFHYKIDIKHITEPEERISAPFIFPKSENECLNVNNNELERILNLIHNSTYSFTYYLNNAEDLFIREKNKIQRQKKKSIQNDSCNPPIENTKQSNISEPHLNAQYILKELANILEIDVFIARNDQNKVFNEEFLGDGTLDVIPYENIPKESKNIISLIDVIWFKNSVPHAAFEIETTTSISSGLLRFSDLIYTLNIPIELYIVTTRNREKKLKKELNRPIFKNTSISQRCKVIYLDDLKALYKLAKPLNGYIKNNILDRIAYDFSYFEEAPEN